MYCNYEYLWREKPPIYEISLAVVKAQLVLDIYNSIISIYLFLLVQFLQASADGFLLKHRERKNLEIESNFRRICYSNCAKFLMENDSSSKITFLRDICPKILLNPEIESGPKIFTYLILIVLVILYFWANLIFLDHSLSLHFLNLNDPYLHMGHFTLAA